MYDYHNLSSVAGLVLCLKWFSYLPALNVTHLAFTLNCKVLK